MKYSNIINNYFTVRQKQMYVHDKRCKPKNTINILVALK